MDELDERLARIGQHRFRAKFRLDGRDRAVVDLRALEPVRRHARELRIRYTAAADDAPKWRIVATGQLDEPARRPHRVDLDQAWQERSERFRAGGDQVAVQPRVHPVRRKDLAATALAIRSEEAEPDGWLRTRLRDRAAELAIRYETS